MVRDEDKTKEQLISELVVMRQQIAELEVSQAEHKSTKWWENAFDSISDLVSIHDNDFRFIWVNRAVANVLKVKPEELIGKTCYEVFHGSNKPPTYCPHTKVLETKKQATQEFFEPHLGMYLQVSVSPIFNKSGEVSGSVHIIKNITKHKRVEEELRKSEEKYRQLFDNASVGIVATNGGKVVLCNAKESELFGYKAPSDLIGRPISEFVYREDLPTLLRIAEDIRSGKAMNHSFTFRGIRADGRELVVETIGIQFPFEGEGVIVAFHTDITERKKMEEELQKFKTISDRAGYGVAMSTPEGNLLYVNEAFATMHGYTSEELIGRHLSIFHAEGQIELVERLRRRLIETGSYVGEEVWHKRKDGTVFPTLMTGTTITDDQGKALYLAATAIDISERKGAEETLAKYKMAVESSTDLIAAVDSQYVYVFANQTFLKYHRLKQDQVVGHTAADILGEGVFRNTVKPNVDRCLQGESIEYEMEHDYPEIGGRYLNVRYYPLRGNDRDTTGIVVAVIRDITERKRVEEELRAKENFRHSLDSSPLGIRIVTAEGETLYANQAMLDIYGYSSIQELITIPRRERYTPESYAEHLKRKETRKGGGVVPTPYEISIIRKNGEVRHLLVFRKEVIWDGKLQYQVLYQDITERKQAEQALRESEEFSSSLLENAPNPIIVLNADTSMRYMNPAAESLTGFTLAELAGRRAPFPWWPPDFPRSYLTDRHDFMNKGIHRAERLFRKKNGEWFWIEMSSTPVKDNGNLKHFIINWVDITERKKAEEALQASEEKYRCLVEDCHAGIATVDVEGKFTFVNRALSRMVGYDAEESLGKPFIDFVDSNDKRRIWEMFRDAIVSPKNTIHLEAKVIHKNGHGVYIDASATALKCEDKLVGALAVITDVTERKQAQEREQHLQQELNLSRRLAAIGELAAGVAHEINNPLTVILGFSERALRKSTDEHVSKDFERIHDEAHRVAKVVQNLLTFARRRETERQYCDINDILEKTLGLRAYELKTGNIELITDLARDLPKVMVDFQQIQEVILNLILNAEQAITEAKRGGKIIIKTKESGGYIRISFTDSGCGISAENMNRLFTPFFTTREDKGGTGLGLSVCHGIVTAHGGRIYAKSKLGEGATFFVELPVTTNETGEVQEKKAPAPVSPLDAIR